MTKEHETTIEVKEVSLYDVLPPIWQKRRIILAVSLVAAVVTFGINYLLSDYFKATGSLLPAPEKGKLSALGQFAEVAALAGVNIPGSEVSKLYPSILSSETILRAVISKKYETKSGESGRTLIEYFEINRGDPELDMDYALKALKSVMSSSFEARTGIVTLSVTMDDPQMAADVLNSTIAELDKFMRGKQSTNASEQVTWLEVRLTQVQDSLRRAEEVLKNFREKNRRVSDSPELLLKQERLSRDVQVNSAVFIELKKQYELAKLEEIKNMQIVNVLDPGRPPAIKIGPRRKTNSAIAFVLALACSSGFVVVRTFYWDKVRRLTAFMKTENGNRN